MVNDICFAVNTLEQYLSAPRITHMVVSKRLFRYIKSTLNCGLVLRLQTYAATLYAHSDACWAGCLDTRQSTSGYLRFLGSNLIFWWSNSNLPCLVPMPNSNTGRSLMHVPKLHGYALFALNSMFVFVFQSFFIATT